MHTQGKYRSDEGEGAFIYGRAAYIKVAVGKSRDHDP